MEDVVAPNSKPSVLLLTTAVLLLALRAFLYYALAMQKSGNVCYALGYSIAQAAVAPALFASLFCIPKKGRTSRRFTVGFVVISGVMLLLDFGQIGQSV